MERFEFTLKTNDEINMHIYVWKNNDVETKGIIQIAHGMAEHALRYEAFSEWITAQGYIVYANDHRGHGKTKNHEKTKGFFAVKDGFSKVTEDLLLLTKYIQQTHPNVPIFLLGHSMGSFLARRIAQLHGEQYAGMILSGTSGDQKLLGKIGLMLAKLERKLRGPYAKSPLMNQLIFGSYNKNFSPPRTKFDFLSRDERVVEQYIKDDNCGFICTTSFYVDLLTGLDLIHRPEEIEKTPKQLPIFLLSGDADPVGDDGKGVQQVYEQYVNLGLQQVSLKLYEGGRHEMLNETNREEVFQDIANWLESILKGEQLI